MINYACRFYRGTSPCSFNKTEGAECPSCRHVSEFRDRILFIKLDAIGDVLRSASLIPSIAARHRAPYIAWLTQRESGDLVRMVKGVDEVLEVSDLGLARAMTGGWDFVYSLSNDRSSASLASLIPAKHPPIGYYAKNGVVTPSNAAAERWLELAAFDRLKRENGETYQRRMMAIIGDEGPFAPPALDVDPGMVAAAKSRVAALFPSGASRLAVNVGAGGRWPKKMLSADQIAAYVRLVRQHLYMDVMLVGGEAESEKTRAIMSLCADDPGIRAVLTPSSVPEFVATLMAADVMLCGDTLALHIATAIGLPTVAIFGPTSAPEIADFNGLIAKTWAKELGCLGCYSDCTKADNCMTLLPVDHLLELTAQQLRRARAVGAGEPITLSPAARTETPKIPRQPVAGVSRPSESIKLA